LEFRFCGGFACSYCVWLEFCFGLNCLLLLFGWNSVLGWFCLLLLLAGISAKNVVWLEFRFLVGFACCIVVVWLEFGFGLVLFVVCFG